MITGILWVLFLIIGIVVNITERIMQKKSALELSKKEIERKTAEKMLDEMIKALAFSIDAKDAYTHGHSERVAKYSLMLAQNLSLSSKECKEIFYSGLVHDVGKIAVPNEIINKTSRLTDEEFEQIKLHPGRGEMILKQIEDMPYLAIGAKYHHEKYDGTGYPSHAKGEEIPILARIIAVADAYDAMTSHRSYRNTLDQSIVKQEIWKGIGTQFDPLVAKKMIALIDADVDYDMREKTDETYDMIEDIKTNEFWANYDPKSIKSVSKVMSDTDVKYFGEFISSVDHWLNPRKLCEVSEEETVTTFTSKTKAEAAYIWNSPIVLLYSSENGEPDAKDYTEYAVFMSAGYSWKTGDTIYEESNLSRKSDFDNWNNWIEKNKEGIKYTCKVRKEKNVVYILIENDYLKIDGHVELPEVNRKIYLSISGEQCEITT